MKVFTLGKKLMYVSHVERLSPGIVNIKYVKELIQGRNYVNILAKLSLYADLVKYMAKFTLGR